MRIRVSHCHCHIAAIVIPLLERKVVRLRGPVTWRMEWILVIWVLRAWSEWARIALWHFGNNSELFTVDSDKTTDTLLTSKHAHQLCLVDNGLALSVGIHHSGWAYLTFAGTSNVHWVRSILSRRFWWARILKYDLLTISKRNLIIFHIITANIWWLWKVLFAVRFSQRLFYLIVVLVTSAAWVMGGAQNFGGLAHLTAHGEHILVLVHNHCVFQVSGGWLRVVREEFLPWLGLEAATVKARLLLIIQAWLHLLRRWLNQTTIVPTSKLL